MKATFETGATTHAVNDLILFTDNTRELAKLRDFIFNRIKSEGRTVHPRDLQKLSYKASLLYCKELGVENSKHILRMTAEENKEYCTLYAAEYDEWLRAQE